MKKLTFLLILALSGCFDDKSDLQQYVANVKANAKNTIEPMPKILTFNHFDYSAKSLRSPFDLPQPESIQEKMQQISGCLAPDPVRRKQPLEKYALSDLTMRGTLGEEGVIWGLLEASDSTLYRVSIGSYIGLYNGKITSISRQHVRLMELIPDGAGCWVERETTIAITESGSER